MKIKINLGDIVNMRLYNTYFLCKRYLPEIQSLKIVQIGGGESRVSEWISFKQCLESLRQIPLFLNEVDEIYHTVPVFERETNVFNISNEIASSLKEKIGNLSFKMQTIIDLYESMNINNEGEELGIDVKLPPCNDLEDYVKYLDDLNFILTKCPLMINDNETLKFKSTDVGSNWVTFLLSATGITTGVSKIMDCLAKMVDKALAIRSHFISIEEQKELLRGMRLKNDLLEKNMDMLELFKDAYLDKAVEDLENITNISEDGDEKGRTKLALEKLSFLVDKGMEIYASIDAPSEVQLLFPTIDTQKQITDNMKYITERKQMIVTK